METIIGDYIETTIGSCSITEAPNDAAETTIVHGRMCVSEKAVFNSLDAQSSKDDSPRWQQQNTTSELAPSTSKNQGTQFRTWALN